MNRRDIFFHAAFGIFAGTAIVPTAKLINTTFPRQAEIAQIKNATRQYRNWYKHAFGKLPVRQARYAADSRIYGLAKLFPELKLGYFTDTPFLEFSSVESAQNFATRNSLTAVDNRVFPNRAIG